MAKPVSTSLTPAQEGQAIGLLAEGKTNAQVATALGCSARTVQRLRQREEIRVRIAHRSDEIRDRAIIAVEPVPPMIWSKVKEELSKDEPDGKQVDALTRAGLNAEKVRQGLNLEHLAAKTSPETKVGVTIVLAPYARTKPVTVVEHLGLEPPPDLDGGDSIEVTGHE